MADIPNTPDKSDTLGELLKINETYIKSLDEEGLKKSIEESKNFIKNLTKELVLCNKIKRSLKDANDTLIKRKAAAYKNKKKGTTHSLPDVDYGATLTAYKNFIENKIDTVTSASMPLKRLLVSKTENVSVDKIKKLVIPIKNHETALIKKINATKKLKDLYTYLLKLVTEITAIQRKTSTAYTNSNDLLLKRNELPTYEVFENNLKALSEEYSTVKQ